jgi:hypothetical protein
VYFGNRSGCKAYLCGNWLSGTGESATAGKGTLASGGKPDLFRFGFGWALEAVSGTLIPDGMNTI